MKTHYDLVVIGGGIQGVGVAQAAAADGYSVLLVEKSGIAEGTSSKSSKLIHGGLRYLESMEFSLVRECLRERAILLKIAPDLVQMRDFYIPLFEQTRRSRLHVMAGLSIYYALANFTAVAKPSIVPAAQWKDLDGLDTANLNAVFRYADAQTDDKLLTKAVMHSAQNLGADLACPAVFLKATAHPKGCEVSMLCGGESRSVTAEVIVNAGGPWVNEITNKISPAPEKENIDLVGGTHIVLDGEIGNGIYYLESPRDGRAIFVMPWYGKTLVGTTERVFRDLPDLIKPTVTEQKYLLSAVGHYFTQYRNLRINDIQTSFAGLRVLPKGKGHAFHRTREVVYKTDDRHRPRALSIYGGKLTAYRATAQNVMRRIRPSLPERQRRGRTDQIRLTHPG